MAGRSGARMAKLPDPRGCDRGRGSGRPGAVRRLARTVVQQAEFERQQQDAGGGGGAEHGLHQAQPLPERPVPVGEQAQVESAPSNLRGRRHRMSRQPSAPIGSASDPNQPGKVASIAIPGPSASSALATAQAKQHAPAMCGGNGRFAHVRRAVQAGRQHRQSSRSPGAQGPGRLSSTRRDSWSGVSPQSQARLQAPRPLRGQAAQGRRRSLGAAERLAAVHTSGPAGRRCQALDAICGQGRQAQASPRPARVGMRGPGRGFRRRGRAASTRSRPVAAAGWQQDGEQRGRAVAVHR